MTRSVEPAGGLAEALRLLDTVLGAAVDRLARRLGPATLLDPWRGMHLERADVELLLAATHHPEFGVDGVAGLLGGAARMVPRLQRVAAEQGLADVDLALLLIALAPDVDLKYEKVYGYLQDDLTRKRPTPDLAANMLACDAEQRLQVLSRMDATSPLMRARTLVLRGSAEQSWIAHAIGLDGPWLNWLLGRELVDPARDDWCLLRQPGGVELDELGLDPDLRARLQPMLCRAGCGPQILLSGPHGVGKFALANALARARGDRLLIVDARTWASAGEVQATMLRAGLIGRLGGALVYLHGVDALARSGPQCMRALMESLAMASSQFVVSCVTPVAPVPGALLHALHADIGFPSAAARAAAWRRALAACGRSALPQAIEQVAIRFVMGAGQIEQAANEEGLVAAVAGPGELSFAALAGAARAQCGAQLGNLAQRIVPQAELASLVLPSDLHAQLRELCARVATREAVRRDWAAGSVHARVVGVTALFAGPSGTGKTLAAEAIAHELGFDLYRIDLASIVSKYIGETEQNLDRVFRAAEHANAVLFFDEADALFGKRSAVKDAHDRYANIEVAYLLQKMEQFDGLAVLATNLKQNLDEAFARRLTFTLNFPFPEQPQRRQLWESLWPPRAPRGADVDFDWLASEFRFSGGNISNTLLAAAHLAAADGQIVMQSHVLRATRREFQKLGKSIAEPARGMVNGAT